MKVSLRDTWFLLDPGTWRPFHKPAISGTHATYKCNSRMLTCKSGNVSDGRH